MPDKGHRAVQHLPAPVRILLRQRLEGTRHRELAPPSTRPTFGTNRSYALIQIGY